MKYYFQIEGKRRDNIGDVLQGMVAKPFLPEDSLVADRETLGSLPGNENAFLVGNGWYMHSFDDFPPPVNVTPLYISVHIANEKLLNKSGVKEHFKKHAPIGCRDVNTMKLLLSWQIPAYYSGCLTTTCQRRTSNENNKEGEALLVDNMHHPVPEEIKKKLETLLERPLIRISHDPPNITGTLENYFEDTEKHMNHLLEKYCKASLVVTTKIHCALPCLAMGANVLLIHPNPDHPRLNPVKEFMEIISYEQILATTQYNEPRINSKKLRERQAFLKLILEKSIQQQKNILSQPDTFELKLIKLKSCLMAQIYPFKRKLKSILKK